MQVVALSCFLAGFLALPFRKVFTLLPGATFVATGCVIRFFGEYPFSAAIALMDCTIRPRSARPIAIALRSSWRKGQRKALEVWFDRWIPLLGELVLQSLIYFSIERTLRPQCAIPLVSLLELARFRQDDPQHFHHAVLRLVFGPALATRPDGFTLNCPENSRRLASSALLSLHLDFVSRLPPFK